MNDDHKITYKKPYLTIQCKSFNYTCQCVDVCENENSVSFLDMYINDSNSPQLKETKCGCGKTFLEIVESRDPRWFSERYKGLSLKQGNKLWLIDIKTNTNKKGEEVLPKGNYQNNNEPTWGFDHRESYQNNSESTREADLA